MYKIMQKYHDKALSELLEFCGGFWAFGQSQFDERAVPGMLYVSKGAGLYVPGVNCVEFDRRLANITKDAIEIDKRENTLDSIILRELSNHEAWANFDMHDTAAALDGYGIELSHIVKIFNANLDKMRVFN